MEKEISPVNKDCFKFQGHDFTLFMLDSVLNIYVETCYPGLRVFEAKVTNSDAESLTKIYNQAQILYELLLDGMPGLLPNVKVWFTDDAKLNYQSEFEIGKKKNIFSFSIAFKEVELEPIKALELKARKLTMTVEAQEIKIKELDDEIKQEKRVIKELEEKISSLKSENKILNERVSEIEKYVEDEKLLKVMNTNEKFSFDTQSINKNHFEFSNENKTIRMKSSNEWKMIFMNKPISKVRGNELVIKINKHNENSGGLMFGVAFSNLKSHAGDYHVDGKYCFLINDGGCSYPDGQKRSNHFILNPQSIIKIKANLVEKSIFFEHGNTQVYKHYLEQNSIEKYDCYFVVFLHYYDDIVTILHQ